MGFDIQVPFVNELKDNDLELFEKKSVSNLVIATTVLDADTMFLLTKYSSFAKA